MGSFLLRRRVASGRVVADRDGVLEPRDVGPEFVLEGSGSFDPGPFCIAVPLCVQVKMVVGAGTAPLVLYEWTRPGRRCAPLGGFREGDDWAAAVAASLDDRRPRRRGPRRRCQRSPSGCPGARAADQSPRP